MFLPDVTVIEHLTIKIFLVIKKFEQSTV